MDSLDNDTINLIIKQIPVLERLQIYKVFNIPRPTQFQVSSELITSKNFRGNKGLIMLAIETGECEPCVQAILMLTRIHNSSGTDLTQYEDDVRSCMEDIDDDKYGHIVKMLVLYYTYNKDKILPIDLFPGLGFRLNPKP